MSSHSFIEIPLHRFLLKSRVDAFFRARRANGPTDETTRGLRTARTTLRERIVKFREQQEQCMPALDDALVVEEVDGDDFAEDDDEDKTDQLATDQWKSYQTTDIVKDLNELADAGF